MSPWNYPVLLTLEPLIDALAAGNTVILKPSAYAPHTSQILNQILKECYPPEYATMITGGREENQALLNQRFDKIFFTGGKTVGKEVLLHAAEYLTPVTLELGGKSPCIVDSTAKISLTAMLLFVTGCFRHWKKKSTGSLANSLFKIRIMGKSSTKNIFTGCRT